MKHYKPPVIGKMILWSILNYRHPDTVIGDFEEVYNEIARNRNLFIAKTWYWFQIILIIPSFIKNAIYWGITMFANYFKIALRVIKKHRVFSFINISGLAVGMACCFLILLWVKDELSYDKHHENHERLYRTVLNVDGDWWTSAPWALAPILKREYPEVNMFTRYAVRTGLVSNGDTGSYETIAFVDPDFFEMFTFSFLGRYQSSPLTSLESVVITESTAKKYFGSEDPIGKVLTLNNDLKLTVTGVIKDPPTTSHMHFSLLAPVRLFGEERLNTWYIESSSYVLLQENTSLDALREKISDVPMKYDTRTNKSTILDLQPITRIHLYSLYGGGNILYVYLFSTIAIFVLLIACINFMNLSTARSDIRAKEVGLRKVVGARRINVIEQFFGESLLFSFIALFFAIGLVFLFLPSFNNLAQKNLRLDLGGNTFILVGLIAITLFTGIVSGSYPALFLSAFHPVRILKGSHSSSSKKPLLRKALVITQFALAIIFIIGTIIVYKQLNYIRNKELGFNRQHVISLPINRPIAQNYQAFKTELLQNPQIAGVTSATGRPTQVGNINPVYWEGRGPDQYEIFKFIRVDYDYIKTFEMEIVDGRDFSRESPTDRECYIVNEEAVRFMKLEQPVGKLFSIWENQGTIIGVIKDFHSRPLHNEIEPLVITMWDNSDWAFSYIFARISPENIPQTLEYVEKAWKKFSPNYPFEYLFLDDVFEQQYRADQQIGTIFKYFTILAIIISCLGIFGLAAFMAEQRTKEIGVRKVLGASVLEIVSLISKEFLILLAFANAIAWPIAYFFINRMLNNYAYRTGIALWVFLLAGASACAIAMITVSFHAVKAARTNPINALRYE